ncbi:MAG: hypothetical protein Q8922_09355 [Bacteroidota bacterium]|nr:hypothetical protein [Bacteroidota bacterium]MDP4234241.1 hypothetical protein [Bacteroidota bacterium]MDP4243431.1 hypothetical protein [Bacteroidota bacterium]MDP4288130.1 hypothetical protein [Bacteroidota bacterium]
MTLSVALNANREQLARALARLERLTRDAIETITHQRQEKHQLERRLSDLTKLVEQERSNFQQRESLLSSAKSETEERAKAFTELSARLNEQERLLAQQLETIGRLESDLDTRAMQIREQESAEAAWRHELEEWSGKVERLEARLAETTAERDEIKKQFYEREREDAQYVVRLSQEDRTRAAKAVDALIDQLSILETRITLTQE